MERIAVAIVGGGPVGMALALHLAHAGVRCLIANTQPDSGWHPRGNTHNCRTMEHYRRLGLSRQIRQLGLPADHPTDVAYFTTLAGHEIARIRMPSEAQKQDAVGSAGPADQVIEPIFRCNQMYVERFLFERIVANKNIDCRFGWECVDWSDQGERVRFDLVNGHGALFAGECQYLVGCDGGQSIVRRKLRIGYSGEPYREQAYAGGLTASTFVYAPDLYRGVIRSRCWQNTIVNHRVRGNLVTLDAKGHFLFSTRPRPQGNESERETILRQLAASVGAPCEAKYLSHFSWTAGQALVANAYGAGRVLMAGDAVHLFTPQGGFGMNTGVDDVANLAWKLAAMVQGWGGPKLLESYEEERRPVAVRNTRAAQAMARRLGEVPVAQSILDDDDDGTRARAAAGAALTRLIEEFASLGIQLGARYVSAIVVQDGRAPSDSDDVYVPSASPGGRAPHVWLENHTSLFDLLGDGFTLLCLHKDAARVEPMRAAAKRRKVPLKVLTIDAQTARDLYECDLALIRPDLHVAWRGHELPADCDRLIGTATGWF